MPRLKHLKKKNYLVWVGTYGLGFAEGIGHGLREGFQQTGGNLRLGNVGFQTEMRHFERRKIEGEKNENEKKNARTRSASIFCFSKYIVSFDQFDSTSGASSSRMLLLYLFGRSLLIRGQRVAENNQPTGVDKQRALINTTETALKIEK